MAVFGVGTDIIEIARISDILSKGDRFLERVLTAKEREYLYYQFLYPEKYWKQLNFYYNANKAWIPARNIEKLKDLELQQPLRNEFLSRIK